MVQQQGLVGGRLRGKTDRLLLVSSMPLLASALHDTYVCNSMSVCLRRGTLMDIFNKIAVIVASEQQKLHSTTL